MEHFDKLRPSAADAHCDCRELGELLLVYTLGDNPLHCFRCKGLLDPQRLGLSAEQVDEVATWCGVFGALYDLWLDSGEYESWAKAQLLAPQGQVNREGLAVRASLTRLLPTYYWWFHDEEDPSPRRCPVCGQPLLPARGHGHGTCLDCQIVV